VYGYQTYKSREKIRQLAVQITVARNQEGTGAKRTPTLGAL